MRYVAALGCVWGAVIFGHGTARADSKEIQSEVTSYLAATKDTFRRGQEEYYARLALEQALEAFKDGNYAIGAVVLLVTDDRVYEFRARNMMITGSGVADHAEARGLAAARSFAISKGLTKGRTLDPWVNTGSLPKPIVYDKGENEHTRRLVNGLHCYGTLEPCPMCLCMILNAGVKVSISAAEDSVAAYAFDEKVKDGRSPPVWRAIRKSQELNGQVIRLLNATDKRLADLSARIFLETREQRDKDLAEQK